MIKQAVKQVGGVGKGVVRQILDEPIEMAKTATQQVTGEEKGVESSDQATAVTNSQQQMPAQPIQPSLIELKKHRIMAANKRELEDLITRQRRERKQEQQQEMIEIKKEEKIEKQEEELEKKNIFQKGLSLVKRKFNKRIETRVPKAA